jgi:hypothetical protein
LKQNDCYFRVIKDNTHDLEKNLLENVTQKINEKEYHQRHSAGAGSFSRERKLTFRHIVVLLMNLLTKSIQKELNHFFKLIRSEDFDINEVSKSAFTQARAKLKAEAFVELSELITQDFYDKMPWMSWLGHRILSCDGSTMVLPDSPQLREQYSTHAFGSGEREKIIARISQLYDPLNDMILHASVGKYTDSEKSLNDSHLPYVQSGDVILMDRYYAAIWLFKVLQGKGAHFVCRLNESHWKVARQMVANGEREKQVEFTVSRNHLGILQHHGIEETKITCRLIALPLKNGDTMVLCTSLLDQEKYSATLVLDLYKKRWGIEESFKVIKCRLDVENFTGKTPRAVLQDFHVKIFLSNLCSFLTLQQQLKIERQASDGAKKHPYKINRSFALSTLKDFPVYFFLKKSIKRALHAFHEAIIRCLSIIRPGRTFQRRPTVRKHSKMNYKPI